MDKKTGSYDDFNTEDVKYHTIPSEIIYPEFRKTLGKAVSYIVLELLLLYFTMPVVMCIKLNGSMHGLWRLEKALLTFNPIDFALFELGLSMIGLLFATVFIGAYLWDFYLFKYGIAPQLSQGEELIEIFRRSGLKLFRYFLWSIFALSMMSGFIWIVLLPAAIGISTFLFMFIVNGYFSMELTRLGLPALANKVMEVMKAYKEG